jgi:hypothetical protein
MSTTCFYCWAVINLVWSAILVIASARLFFASRELERRIDLRNRWLINRERKERQL